MLIAILAAGLAAALLGSSPPRLAGDAQRSRRLAPWLVVPVPLLLVWRPSLGIITAVGLAAVGGAVVLLRQRRRRRAATIAGGRVVETCELVAAELSAGQTPARALELAARAWPELGPVAQAHQLGGDVPEALRRVALLPGAGDLRLLAAAWVVAHRTGGGLADAVRRSADSIRQHRSTTRLVEGELASARATARLVAALPVVALAMGSSSGADPLGFLLGGTAGYACLVGGLAFGALGLWWIERIADAAAGPP